MPRTRYVIRDRFSGERIKDDSGYDLFFDSKSDARHYIENNGLDRDTYEIVED